VLHPRRLVAIAGVALPLVLIGATTTSMEAAASPRVPSSISSKPVSASAWTHKVCQSLSKWEAKIKSLASSMSSQLQRSATVAGARKGLTQFLQKVGDATGQLVQQTDGAGTPKVDQGKAVAQFFHDALTQLKQVFSQGLARAKNLPNDPQAFASAAENLGTQIQNGEQQVGTVFSDAKTRFSAPDIDAALKSDPACSSLNQ